jgi:hypothetical protein
MKITALISASVITLMMMHAAQAKDAADLCGEYTSVDVEEKTVDMGNNIFFMAFRSSTQMNAKEDSKYNQLSGQCTGGAVIYPDKTIEAEGLCAVEDVSGDVLTYAFTQGRQDKQGKFQRKGGTGKFANAKDTGWYAPVSLSGDMTKGNWGGKGACK